MGKIGSPHIKDFESKFRERGLEPLEKIKDAKHKVDCIDKEGYKYRLCYRGAISDKRTKNFNKWDKNNPFKPYNMRLYASRVQTNCEILSSDEELFEATTKRIRFKCPDCGKEFTKKWCHWIAMPLNRHVCPSCNDKNVSSGKSQISLLTKQWLDENNIKYNQEHTFPSCKNKKCLRFDFCVEWDNNVILIECDGSQHYYTSGWTDENKLLYNQCCDKIKEEFCKNMGYILVRIPFWLYKTDTYKNILNKTFFG